MSDWDDLTSVTEAADAKPATVGDRERAYLIVLAGTTVGEMFKLPGGDAVIGRGRNSDVPLHDDGVSRAHARIVHAGEQVFVEDLGSRNGTFVNGDRVDGRRAIADGDKIQVGRTTILKFTYHDSLEESFQKQMYESALRDGLTKVYNKRYFTERIASEMRFAVRHRAMLALLLLDLDHFKQINDQLGHLGGDEVLRQVARITASQTREADLVARYGGEEFILAMPNTESQGAFAAAENIREAIAARRQSWQGTEVKVTVSAGVAQMQPDEGSLDGLIARADEALYQAKAAGRNCTRVLGSA